MDACALPVDADGQVEPVGRERKDVGARADVRQRDRVDPLALERQQRLGHLAGPGGELGAAGKLAKREQRGLLAARAVERPQASRRKPELEKLLERVRARALDLALVHVGDERREPVAPALVVRPWRAPRLRLGQGYLLEPPR